MTSLKDLTLGVIFVMFSFGFPRKIRRNVLIIEIGSARLIFDPIFAKTSTIFYADELNLSKFC